MASMVVRPCSKICLVEKNVSYFVSKSAINTSVHSVIGKRGLFSVLKSQHTRLLPQYVLTKYKQKEASKSGTSQRAQSRGKAQISFRQITLPRKTQQNNKIHEQWNFISTVTNLAVDKSG